MSRMATYASEEGLARDPDAPKPEEIVAQLHSILASPVFLGSKRCHQFLDYVCRKSMAGEAGALKERAIAIEVFGRHPDTAGQGEDTIVRVGAREVRKRLAQFYVTPEGAASTVLIELPPGSYVPEFRYAAIARLQNAAPAAVPEVHLHQPEARPDRRPRGLAVAGICLAATVAAAFAVGRSNMAAPPEAAFQRFWAPVFQSQEPLLIGIGHPIVYQPSRRATLLNAQRLPPTPFPTQQKVELPAEDLDGSDMVPVMNQFVGFGDMVAANEVSQMLARRSRAVRLLLASSIPFAELRLAQTYLIGSLSNQWTMQLAQNWRFQFAWGADHIAMIKDTQPGSARQWTIPVKEDGSTPDDYSMICRIRNSPTGALLLISAGIKQFGTEAAGRLLTEPSQLGAILNRLPKGWEDKNLQIVLHMRVIGNAPAQPEVVASHVW